MKKQGFFIYLLLFMVASLIFASSCKKNGDGIPVLTTSAIAEITETTANSGGTITSDGGSPITSRGVCWSTGETPTLSDYITIDGTGSGSFASSLSGLEESTTYYVRAYATNSNGTGYGNTLSFTTLEGGSGGSFTDPRDGTVYSTVMIGTQVWMAENLKYMPIVVGPGTGSFTTHCYYVYGYDGTNVDDAKATANYTTYGVLYNWSAAMAGSSSSTVNPSGVHGVCPPGWHLPSDAEWNELIALLGGGVVAGGKLKETGTTHWLMPNTGATNETGFTSLPGGIRGYGAGHGGFSGIGNNGVWWSATESKPSEAWGQVMGYGHSGVGRVDYEKDLGLSVRCLRDH